MPDKARQDPAFRRTGGRILGRDGCRVPLPWRAGPSGPSWLPQPPDWGRFSVETESADPESFLTLYRTSLRLRREHPALGRGTMRWLESPPDSLIFSREPGFVLAANLGQAAIPLPTHSGILLTSGPVSDGSLPPDTAAWLVRE